MKAHIQPDSILSLLGLNISFKYQLHNNWWWSNIQKRSCQYETTKWKCSAMKIVSLAIVMLLNCILITQRK